MQYIPLYLCIYCHIYRYPLGQRRVILHDSIVTFLSVIPAMVHQNLDSVILIGPVMVGYGVHSFQSICIMLMAWCCMICLEDSTLSAYTRNEVSLSYGVESRLGTWDGGLKVGFHENASIFSIAHPHHDCLRKYSNCTTWLGFDAYRYRPGQHVRALSRPQGLDIWFFMIHFNF